MQRIHKEVAMHKRTGLVIVMVVALAVLSFAPLVISQTSSQAAQLPEYYEFYSPEQFHDTWMDCDNDEVIDPYENTELPIEARVEDLLSRMTLDEKVSQIPANPTPAIDRLGIPGFNWYADESLHGVAAMAPATVLPFNLAIAATYDEDLIHEAFSAIGDEFRAAFNMGQLRGLGLVTWSPSVVDINRDMRWQRASESYGEDPCLTSRMVVAATRGFQGEDDDIPYEKAIVTAKHYVANKAPLGRDFLRPDLVGPADERTTREISLIPYKAAIREGNVGQIMTAFLGHGLYWDNVPCSYSRDLLTEVLRDQWGFDGFVCADCGAIDGSMGNYAAPEITKTFVGATKVALEAGVDSNACGSNYGKYLAKAVEDGIVDENTIDQTLRRLLSIRFQLGLFDPPGMSPYNDLFADNVLTAEHIELALQTARESIVLLKNEGNLLPLDKESIRSIAVIGPNANDPKTLYGCFTGTPPHWVTPLEGIQNAVAPETEVRVVTELDLQAAINAAEESDVAIVVVGPDQGAEGTSRTDLSLENIPDGEFQLEVLQAVYNTGTPTVVVIVNGTPISSDWMKEHIPAIVEALYGGMEGGTALAEVLFGDYNPGGKLPFTIPSEDAELPIYYNHNGELTYDESTYLWPFGYGLSYTEFEYDSLVVSPKSTDSGNVQVSVDVKNVGNRKGDAVVELYVRDVEASVPVPVKQLKRFDRVALEPGESKTVEFVLKPDDISLLDENLEYVVEPGTFDVIICNSSMDIVLRDNFEVTAPIRAKFEYENLEVSESELDPDEPFEVSATIVGIGGMEEGEVRLYVDDNPVDSRKVCLASGETRDISPFTLRLYEGGTHSVTIGDLPSVTLTVSPKPAEFEYGSLVVTEPVAGDITVNTSVKNIGSYDNTDNVKLYVNNEVVDYKELILGPGEKETLSFGYHLQVGSAYKIWIANLVPVRIRIPGELGTVSVDDDWVDPAKVPGNLTYGENAFASIGDGVGVVGAGGEILVMPGIYDDSIEDFPIVIDRPVVLRSIAGAESTVIDGGGSNIISVTAENATIDGFTVRNGMDGISVGGRNNTVINNIATSNAKTGISVGGENITLINNIATSNSSGISPGGNNVMLINNTINNSNGFGVDAWGNNITLINNTINSNADGGLYLGGGCGFTLINNTASSNGGNGFELWDLADGITVINNTVTLNEGHGIWVGGNGITVENNTVISNKECGIYVNTLPYRGSSSDVTITSNLIENNLSIAVRIVAPSLNTLIHYNNMEGNGGGIINEADVMVDATMNWWGTIVESKIASMISGPVEYEPWLDAPLPLKEAGE